MKKIITTLTAVALIALLLTHCKKYNTTFNSYFYTSKDSNEVQLSLYIDGNYKGDLPYLTNKPTCDNDSLKQKALFLTLQSGKYKIVAKDKQDNIKSSSTLKITNNSMDGKTGNGGSGGLEATSKDNCLIVGVFY
ncbi:MAG: hypothetical protein HY738_00665 [Bacteroidia bacterium]|nr:hypothetical protein [Bacteroidia bacterium]